jgi:hypothetical protein
MEDSTNNVVKEDKRKAVVDKKKAAKVTTSKSTNVSNTGKDWMNASEEDFDKMYKEIFNKG